MSLQDSPSKRVKPVVRQVKTSTTHLPRLSSSERVVRLSNTGVLEKKQIKVNDTVACLH